MLGFLCPLQNLLLCGKHSWYLCHTTPTSPTNSVSDLSEGRLNPITTVFLQAWQLLSLATSLFLPKQSIMWHLKVHLQRNADPRYPTEAGICIFTVNRLLYFIILETCHGGGGGMMG